MMRPSSLSRPIIEALYDESLILADDVRAVFALGAGQDLGIADDATRLALSSEGLKATTRMMHVLAWLLNHRAFLSGEMTVDQLRRHGRLPEDRLPTEKDMLRLEPPTRELVNETVKLHQRILRLDKAWRDDFVLRPGVHVMHEHLDRSISNG
jgi:regulator of CtrA degradation